MKYKKRVIHCLIFVILLFFINSGCFPGDSGGSSGTTTTANHEKARVEVIKAIPESMLNKVRSELIIAYGHTSHGSQVVDGLAGLEAFMVSRGHAPGKYSGLVLRDQPFSGADDLGNPDRVSWESATRTYLGVHPEVNVVVWSWCGQVSTASESDINTYLSLMNGLERDYPDVKFVYMTGHLDGTGLSGNLHLRNEQIRNFCRSNDGILFDFADIETYNPDGAYFGDRHPTDGCNYDFDNDGVTSQTGDPAEPVGNDRNWATDWQNSNVGDWYSCGSAHSKPLNANMKAFAFWWLMAQIAGADE